MAQKQKPPQSSAAWLEQAHILTEALPFMQRYDRKIIVIKFGGHAMGDAALMAGFARDVVLLKQAGVHPIIVHGGGPQIATMLERLNIQSKFAQGLRITDAPTIAVVEMVLGGAVNKQIVTAINQAGGTAIGLSGKDANLIKARKTKRKLRDPDSHIEKIIDLGFVGKPQSVNADFLYDIVKLDIIPVIAPIAMAANGQSLNVNADMAAGAVAATLKAERLLLLTDVAGVLDKKGALIKRASVTKARQLIRNKTAQGGMIPKLETAIEAVKGGVGAAVILDGRVPQAILLELFTELGVGTLIAKTDSK